tara:strand:+ start:115 stop:1047 length:933 start_codon:yes stop_codon:yes gene_type:complete
MSNIKFIFIYSLLGSLVFVIYFFISSPVYTSSVTFYTDYTDSDSLSLLNPFLDKLDGDNSELSFSVSDYVKSDKFLSDIIQVEYEVDGEIISLSDYWGNTKNPLIYFLRFNRSLMFEKTLTNNEKNIFFTKRELSKKITFSVDRKSGLNIMHVSLKNHPELAQQIVYVAYKSILNYSTEITNVKANEKKYFITSRIDKVKLDLEEKEKKMLSFLETNKKIESPFLLLEKDRIQTDINLLKQVFITLSDQLELAKIEAKKTTNSVFLLDAPTKPTVRIGFSLFKGIFYGFIFSFFIVLFVKIYFQRKSLFL